MVDDQTLPTAQDVLEEYVARIRWNIEAILKEKQLARENWRQTSEGDYIFEINQQDETLHIIEQKDIVVSEELADAVFNYVAPQKEKTALELEKESIVRKEIVQENVKSDSLSQQIQYYQANRADVDKSVAEKIKLLSGRNNNTDYEQRGKLNLLIDKCVAPAIVNRGMNYSVRTAYNREQSNINQLDVAKDKGYCTKTVITPLYELQDKYGGLGFLPKDIEQSAHPQNFQEHIESQYIKEGVDVSSVAEMQGFKQGDLIVVDGRHAMFFDGIKEGKPCYIGFNNDVSDFSFLSERRANVIEISKLIEHYPPQKSVNFENKEYRLGDFAAEKVAIPVFEGLEEQRELFKVQVHIFRAQKVTERPTQKQEKSDFQKITDLRMGKNQQNEEKINAEFQNPGNAKAAKEAADKKLERTGEAITDKDIAAIKTKMLGGR